MSSEVEVLAEHVGRARRVVVLSGAGVSQESGIATYRGAGSPSSDRPAPPPGVARRGGLLWAFAFGFARLHPFLVATGRSFLDARPNPAHEALASLEAAGRVEAIITQNVDGLHLRAGSQRVLELHGSFFRSRCRHCDVSWPVPRDRLEALIDELHRAGRSRRTFIRTYRRLGPRCPTCGRLGRPDVVFFGEPLDADLFAEAEQLCAECDLLLVVGSTALVRPANDLPWIANYEGATLAEVNPQETAVTPFAAVHVAEGAATALPKLARALSSPA